LQRANRDKHLRVARGADPIFNEANVKHELADKSRSVVYGGAGLMLQLARQVGLAAIPDPTIAGDFCRRFGETDDPSRPQWKRILVDLLLAQRSAGQQSLIAVTSVPSAMSEDARREPLHNAARVPGT
jgi:hypothetical protein